MERDICRSTKVDVRNQEFDIDELASEKAVCTPWKLVEYEEIVQHLRAKTKIFEEPIFKGMRMLIDSINRSYFVVSTKQSILLFVFRDRHDDLLAVRRFPLYYF